MSHIVIQVKNMVRLNISLSVHKLRTFARDRSPIYSQHYCGQPAIVVHNPPIEASPPIKFIRKIRKIWPALVAQVTETQECTDQDSLLEEPGYNSPCWLVDFVFGLRGRML